MNLSAACNILSSQPSFVAAYLDEGNVRLQPSGSDVWGSGGMELRLSGSRLVLHAPGQSVRRVLIRWRHDLSHLRRILGDHWERSYGDLEWRGFSPQRPMPWYCVGWDGHTSFGWGVKTGPNAFCHWHLDEAGVSLWLDVRSGGRGVRLREAPLEICELVELTGHAEERPFDFLHRFCRSLCDRPRLSPQPLYGFNDWYYAYGNNDPDEILETTRFLVDLCPHGSNRPYSVVDAGWSPGSSDGPPYDRGNARWGSMSRFAERAKSEGARPGIWTRPLVAGNDAPAAWRLGRSHESLDPTNPDALRYVADMISRFREWGFELVKHDFSSYDIVGRWGFQMGSQICPDRDWSFQDPSKTTAQAVLDLYRTIREAAADMVVLGCNTFSHLSAGIFEACRIGDDTSGRSWDRTRRMGVNTLAFRGCQTGAFYAADPDVAAITPEIPWSLGSRWLDLVARSGSALFVSVDRKAAGEEQKSALRRAFEAASRPQPLAEPLDWLESNCPRSWRVGGKTITFDWMDDAGPWPFSD